MSGLVIQDIHWKSIFICNVPFLSATVSTVLLREFTSQKNSFSLSPQNQEIHDTSSELLIFVSCK